MTNELFYIWKLIIVNALLVVHFINLETRVSGVMETSGKIPVTHFLQLLFNIFYNFPFLYACSFILFFPLIYNFLLCIPLDV